MCECPAFADRSRTLTISRHDKIAKVLGITSRGFEDEHPDEVTKMQRMILVYVKSLLALKSGRAGAGYNAAESAGPNIQVDAEGFPQAPSVAGLDKLTKDDLERLYRGYITDHYSK
jgi:hypothetical protein